jgi:hypothetical protein
MARKLAGITPTFLLNKKFAGLSWDLVRFFCLACSIAPLGPTIKNQSAIPST